MIYAFTNLQNYSQIYSNFKSKENKCDCVMHLSSSIVMDLHEFNDYYVNNLLDKLSKENITVFLLGDFNIDLMNYDQHSLTNEFLDSLSSHMLLPHIAQPTRIKNNSKTLIGNIY